MIMYTTMPLELVFENMDQTEKQSIREISMGAGVTMLVEPISSSEGKIVRLISPNPQDYLNPRYAPGQTISFQPEFN
ncbi:YlzJ-like family protein [Brevibacillus migulae]|uniref:YlzJ-like family protein n=1 Tax=Brevibacillus migulae TaxID=1644114 RepID=UPI00106EDBB9|nr:YlzJ-like family protein [Brevibacillus migulae]